MPPLLIMLLLLLLIVQWLLMVVVLLLLAVHMRRRQRRLQLATLPRRRVLPMPRQARGRLHRILPRWFVPAVVAAALFIHI